MGLLCRADEVYGCCLPGERRQDLTVDEADRSERSRLGVPGTRFTLPTCTPKVSCLAYQASTPLGSDELGMCPRTRLLMVFCPCGPQTTPKSFRSIGREQAQVGSPVSGPTTVVECWSSGRTS